MSSIIERSLVRENNKLREENARLKHKDLNTYKYFVSYLYWDKNAAGIVDNEEIMIGKKIQGIEDIRYMQEVIKSKRKVSKVVVTNFILIDTI